MGAHANILAARAHKRAHLSGLLTRIIRIYTRNEGSYACALTTKTHKRMDLRQRLTNACTGNRGSHICALVTRAHMHAHLQQDSHARALTTRAQTHAHLQEGLICTPTYNKG